MFAHEAPELLQSCHWYAYELGLLVHDPLVVVSFWPCCVVPLMTGGALLDGGLGVDPVTVAVTADGAEAEPPPLVAVTTARTR